RFPSHRSHRHYVWNGNLAARANRRAPAGPDPRPWQRKTDGPYRQKRRWRCVWCPRKSRGSSRREGSSGDPISARQPASMNKQLEKDRPIIRALPWDSTQMSREILLTREWLVTNGLGGYASGTVSGAVTRRYHGLLIAALSAPLGRIVMWNHVSKFLRFGDDDVVWFGGEESAGRQLGVT